VHSLVCNKLSVTSHEDLSAFSTTDRYVRSSTTQKKKSLWAFRCRLFSTVDCWRRNMWLNTTNGNHCCVSMATMVMRTVLHISCVFLIVTLAQRKVTVQLLGLLF